MDNILFLCIGDSNIAGDSLGPLIGSFIDVNKHKIQTNTNIKVIGTMNSPIGYNTINETVKNIDTNVFTVLIDSALGSENNIGKIVIDNSNLCAGKGVNIGKNLTGDITIRGIVGKNHENIKLNTLELKTIPANKIDIMANKIVSILLAFLCTV